MHPESTGEKTKYMDTFSLSLPVAHLNKQKAHWHYTGAGAAEGIVLQTSTEAVCSQGVDSPLWDTASHAAAQPPQFLSPARLQLPLVPDSLA